MARRNLALAPSARNPSNKKRNRRDKRRDTSTAAGPREVPFNDLERAFFAAAPPDVPASAPEPERFDDLERVSAPPDGFAVLRRWAAAAAAAFRRLGATLARRFRPALASADQRNERR
jgi:hypothetical protein